MTPNQKENKDSNSWGMLYIIIYIKNWFLLINSSSTLNAFNTIVSTIIFHPQNPNSAGDTECQRVGTTTATVVHEKQNTLVLPFHCFSQLSFLITVFFPFINWRVTDLEKGSLTFNMTFSKKSYKTHQLETKKHPGIPQLTFEPIKDFNQGSKMSSTVIMLIHSNDSKFHGNNLELPQEWGGGKCSLHLLSPQKSLSSNKGRLQHKMKQQSPSKVPRDISRLKWFWARSNGFSALWLGFIKTS